MDSTNDTPDNNAGGREWRRTYRIVFLTGIAYILILGLFTWLFNDPI